MKKLFFGFVIGLILASSGTVIAQEGEASTEEFYLELPKQSSKFIADLPPILTIDSISFSEQVLDAKEIATLSVSISNVGPGEARDVYVKLTCSSKNILFSDKSYFLPIAANGGNQKIDIELIGEADLTTSECLLQIEVIDPIFKVNIKGKQLKFPTRESPKPKLILAKYGIYENQSASPNSKIDINETIDLNFAIQNIGNGTAEDVLVEVITTQDGVLSIGHVDNKKILRKNPEFSIIESGKYENITFRYYVNSEFMDSELEFRIRVIEKSLNYGVFENISFPINTKIETKGHIRTIEKVDAGIIGNVIIEDIPNFKSDVDLNIPVIDTLLENSFALIIGNENYANEIPVTYALNDASTFRKYAINTLGVPEKHLHFRKNATYGQMISEIDWVKNVIDAYEGNAKIYFYYAGHGIPDASTKSAYLLPVDGIASNTKSSIELSAMYQDFEASPSDGVYVFLDACFSGGSREGMLTEGRGVSIKPKDNILKKNTVVFSAASDDETAHPFKEQSHGLFTYFLLKKLQETKGEVTLKELSDYIRIQVKQKSVVENKPQHPSTNVGQEIKETWEGFYLK